MLVDRHFAYLMNTIQALSNFYDIYHFCVETNISRNLIIQHYLINEKIHFSVEAISLGQAYCLRNINFTHSRDIEKSDDYLQGLKKLELDENYPIKFGIEVDYATIRLLPEYVYKFSELLSVILPSIGQRISKEYLEGKFDQELSSY